MGRLPVGKLQTELLGELLDALPGDDSVVLGPSVGGDAAVLDVGAGEYIVAKSDPITFAAESLALFALSVNANDVYVTGGKPKYFLATLLLPSGISGEEVRGLFAELKEAAEGMGVSVVGGHTEVVSGLSEPIVCGSMIGSVRRDLLIRNVEAQPGDPIVLCGEVAVEGTAIMARAAPGLAGRILGEAHLSRCRNLLFEPGINVGPLVEAVMETVKPRACHDPTDGGLIAGLSELAASAGCGIVVERSEVPVLPECGQLCREFGPDPLRLIASGSVLCAFRSEEVEPVLSDMRRRGLVAQVIGRLCEKSLGNTIISAGQTYPFPSEVRDEIVRFYEKVLPGEERGCSD